MSALNPVYWLVSLACIGCAGRGSDDKLDACARMRDHFIELRLADFATAKDSNDRPIDLSGQRKALRNALGSNFIDDCADHMTRRQLACAIASKSTTSYAECK